MSSPKLSTVITKPWPQFIKGFTIILACVLIYFTLSFTMAPPANDDCANAINLVSGASCVATAGTNVEATQSIPAITCGIFTSSSALDVWYKWTATAISQTITVVGAGSFDAIIDVRSGACNGTNIGCADATTTGGTEIVTVGGLTIGNVYLIRVYGWAGGTGTFTICLTGTAAGPTNDDCANATNLVSSTTCTATAGTNVGAIQSIAPITCAGFTSSSALDVWYKFTAVSTTQTVTVVGGTGFDAIIDVRSGVCNGTNIGCADGTVSGGTEVAIVSGLTIGNVYLVRVYGWAGGTGTFTICVTGTPPAGPANDDCTNATTLTPGATCTPTNGTTVGATQSIAAITCASFTGTSDDDVWYKFVATSTNHTVTVVGGASFDAVVDARSGACNGSNIGCADATVSGGTEIVMLSGLTIGSTYLVRVYSFSSLVSAQGTFTICVTTPGPANDNCASAITLTPGTSCTPTSGTTVGATQSIPAITCATFTGTADDDVWYQFVATSSNHTITVVGSAGFDAVVDVRSGACNGSNIGCADGTVSGGTETVVLSGLTTGTTYLVRVYSFGSVSGNQGAFTICVTTPAPSNDNCANATTLTPSGSCVPTNGTTVGATQSIPAITCATFTGTANDDVWYQFVATSANHTVTVVGSPGFDAVVDVRSGACNGSNIGCADGTVSGGTETVVLSGLTPGSTYYVRVYSFGNASGNQGTFNICVFTPGSSPGCPPNPTSPTNGQVTCPSATTTLSWPAVGGSTSYDVYFGTSTPPPFIANTASTTFVVNTPSNTTYYWQIRPVSASGTASGCAIWNFVKGDVMPPVITCPANVTAFTPVGSCTATATYGAITATDNCTAPVITLVSGGASGSAFPIGVSIIVFRATDSAGNSSSCSFTVTVVDNVAPSITCPANVTVNTSPGVCNAVATYGAITAIDNCTAPVITLVSGGVSGSIFQLGINTIIYRATDLAGNSSTCAFTVTVRDIQPPTITCPVGLTVQCASLVPAVATGSVTAADNCGPPAISFVADVITNQTCANRFTLTRYYRATDVSGNSASCSQIIVVNDNTAPIITLTDPLLSGIPNGGTVYVQCFGQDPSWDPPVFSAASASVSDNCSATPILTYNEVLFDEGNCPVDGYINRYKLTWTATDVCGNSSSRFVFLDLIDDIPPVLHGIPADITAKCDQLPAPPQVTSTDECLCECIITYNQSSPQPGCQNGQIITRSWSVKDFCGNVATGVQHITLLDEDGPVISMIAAPLYGIPNNSVLTYTCNEGGIPAFYKQLNVQSVSSPSSCGGVPSMSFNSTKTEANNCEFFGYIEERVFTWTGKDLCGNTSAFVLTVHLVDDEAPVLINVPQIACEGDPALKEIEAIDNCGQGNVRYWDVEIPNPCGTGKAKRRTYEGFDPCGNTVRDTTILLPDDNIAPTLTFTSVLLAGHQDGDVITMECRGNGGQSTSLSVNDVTASDNCSAGLDVHFSESIIQQGGCDNGGALSTLSAQWTATDLCGNVTQLHLTIKVVDHTPPAFNGGVSDVVIGCNDKLPVASATDNCGTPTITTIDSIVNSSCQYEYDVYRRLTAVDQCGNTTTHQQHIHVGNNSGPVISGIPAVSCDNKTLAEGSAYDVCAQKFVPLTYKDVNVPNSCIEGSIIKRTWSAVDACGHVSTFVQQIIMGDRVAPKILIPSYSIINKFIDNNFNQIYLSQETIIKLLNELDENSVTAEDNCSQDIEPVFTLVHHYSSNCVHDGYYDRRTYSWLAQDACGNKTLIFFSVDIIDDVAPIFTSVPNGESIYCSPLPPAGFVTVEDPAGPVNVLYTEEIGSEDINGQYDVVRTWTATDACGNVAVATQLIDWIPNSLLSCGIILPSNVECNTHNVLLDSYTTGGLGNLTYQWEVTGGNCFIQGGQGTGSISIYIGFATVDINLTVTDAFGCSTVCNNSLDCIDPLGFVGNPSAPIADAENKIPSLIQDFPGIDAPKDRIQHLSLWPNPADETINITFHALEKGMTDMRMLNLQGQPVWQNRFSTEVGENVQRIDLKDIPDSGYLLYIQSGQEVHTQLFTVVKSK